MPEVEGWFELGGLCVPHTVGFPLAKDLIMSIDQLDNSTLKEVQFKDLFFKKGTLAEGSCGGCMVFGACCGFYFFLFFFVPWSLV